MQDLALYIIKQLVNNPDDVTIEEQNSGQGEITLLVSVNPDDMGIVIGKSGQTIKAIRRVLSIRAITENVRVNLQLVEPEGGRQRTEEGKSEVGESEEESKEKSGDAEIQESNGDEATEQSSNESDKE